MDVSSVVVTFQAVGTLLLALIIAQLARIFVFRYARTWSLAFTALSFALVAVRVFISTGARVTWVAFLAGEWMFLLLLWAGCREIASGIYIAPRKLALALPGFVAIAALMTYASSHFNAMFVVQTAIVSIGAGISFVTLTGRASTKGTRTLQTALLTMMLLYAVYVPLFWIHQYRTHLPFLQYSSLVDLLADVFLGCAMILVTAESEKHELNSAVAALGEAQGQLERRLQTDPLTEVMSRHAFHAMQHGDEVTTAGVLQGVVAMIDVDNLKTINDEIGHAAGDVVIRAAANAVRNLIRADDLLFRWGGDEFVAIMPNMTRELMLSRFRKLDTGLTAKSESGFEIPFHVSWGEAEFGVERSLDEAIKLADEKMYASRKA